MPCMRSKLNRLVSLLDSTALAEFSSPSLLQLCWGARIAMGIRIRRSTSLGHYWLPNSLRLEPTAVWCVHFLDSKWPLKVCCLLFFRYWYCFRPASLCSVNVMLGLALAFIKHFFPEPVPPGSPSSLPAVPGMDAWDVGPGRRGEGGEVNAS